MKRTSKGDIVKYKLSANFVYIGVVTSVAEGHRAYDMRVRRLVDNNLIGVDDYQVVKNYGKITIDEFKELYPEELI